MNPLRTPTAVLAAFLFLWSTAFSVRALDDLVITEVMAVNDSTLTDEDGDHPDWIEIYNAGTNSVNLNGWYLTDNAGNLTKWRFPETNLNVNAYLLVFASNKDRRVAGRPLHSNFQLNNTGEYVGLVKPDGTTVQSAFAPFYPIQVADVSYGVPTTTANLTLVSNGAPGRFTVPLNGALGSTWTLPGFNDASWTSVNNGVGFEGGGALAGVGAVIADSTNEFSGNQGSNGWYYGYWNKKADANGTYEPGDFIAFPRGVGTVLNDSNYFNGTNWMFPPPNNPPWTLLSRAGGNPSAENGNASLPIHWAIRRYVSEANGPVRITGIIACNSAGGTCGDGTFGRILVDGVEVWSQHVFGTSLGYSIVANASLGSTIDFVIDPGAGGNDQCDGTTFTATVRMAGDAAVVADTMADWSDRGVQGQGGWTYGYFIKTNAGLTYATNRFVPFPSGTGPQSTANFWNGESWHWFEGDPPFDTLGQVVCRPSIFPSGTTNGLEHWVIRRWVSEISGAISIDWHFAKKDLTGVGTTAKVFHNGTLRDTIALTGTDFTGAIKFIPAFNVQVGDAIDFTVEPGADVAGDICFLNATIHGSTTLSNQFNTDVGVLMTNINASAYLRIPFTASNAATFVALTLRMKYDDGFIAYLNGTAVAGRNAPDPTNFNSTATASRPDAQASQFEEIDLTKVVGLLLSGNNVLAIQGLNSSATDSDFLITAELRATTATLDPSMKNYFAVPTPGAVNGAGSASLGPLVTDIKHAPHDPADNEDLYVTAAVTPTLATNPVTAVRLYYRVQFGAETNILMLDDGLHADGLAGDGVYGAVVPNTISGPGQMIRYYVTATAANNALTRQPPFPNATFSAQYFGAVVQNPTLTNALSVLHLFITEANLNGANNDNNARYPCSLYWLGEFYDNVGINRHGQSSTGFPKKSYDIDFNADHHFRWDPNEPRVDDINLLTTYPDKAKMRNMLSYDTYRDAGAPYHYVVPVRVQTNGGFYGDWHIVENGDANFLKRIGRDPNGALYKMYNTFTSIGNTTIGGDPNAEKKTRKQEGNADLVALFVGISTNNLNVRTNYMYDNVNVSEVVNVTAARNLTADVDCCHKNYYFYRDSDGTGEWEAMPWDVDLSFGRNWQGADNPATPAGGDGCSCYWDTNMWSDNYVLVGGNNSFWQAIFNTPATRQMYYRRLRTLMDEQLQPTNTPAFQLHYETRVNQLAALLQPDGQLDLLKWGTWASGVIGPIPTTDPQYQNVLQAAAVLTTNYLPARRLALYNRTAGNSAEIPNSQPSNAVIRIGNLDYNPTSGNQAEEYFQLINTNNYAVDISGWRLAGAVDLTLQGGTVMPSNSVMYVAANKKAFRARAAAPKGGMGLYIEGPYKGQLSARGETILLSNKFGVLVASNSYSGNPTPAQQGLRITEIMYHPPKPPSGPYEAEDFEYIELKNVGGTALDLSGVHFGSGVEFSFTGSAVTNLGPGQYVLVVRNLAAFNTRYGPGFNIAGQYVGILANEGEEISLYDSVGEEILDFEYNNTWYPVTDGPGASLVIVNENAAFNTWGLKESWRPSYRDFGAPGQSDPPLAVVAPILINEVLSHTDPPLVDAVELLNTNGVAVNLSGWFLSDDFATPKKYRIPNGTTIAAGGYLVFDETQFNTPSNAPGAFSFSSTGDEAYLFSGDGTNLTGYLHGYSFGAAESGVSFGRYRNSQGDVHFVAQSANTITPPGPNAPPKVGPIVISEISYHPADGVGGADNQLDEFLELANITGSPVPLYDPSNPANTWRLRSAVDFDFPGGISVPGGAHILIVSFDPTNTPVLDAFRQRWNVGGNVAFFGPYDGKLDNSGESVRVYRPDLPEGADVPYILVDQVDYSQALPWPAATDGPSLQKRVETAYGNDATNWIAAGPSPGGPFVPGGIVPSVSSQPANVSAVLGNPAMLTVNATGTAPLFYQWRFGSNNIPGAVFSTLTIPSVKLTNAGPYSVIVYNSAGRTESSNATLTVLIPASIVIQPVTAKVRVRPDPAAVPTTNAVFTVAASGTTTISYQWRFNGTNILGQTNDSLTITNVQVKDGGLYSAAITDNVGTIFTTNAPLYPLVTPVIVQAPLAQTVPQGGLVGVSVVLGDGNPPPFYYEWRRGSPPVAKFTNNFKTNIFTFVNTNLAGTVQTYRLVVTNLANPTASSVFAAFDITTVADTDHDGMSDAFEIASGLNPNDANDAMLDPDGDKMTNLAESLAGTDPSDPNSFLRVDQNTVPGSAVIGFGAISNRTYSIQYSTQLPAASWSKLADIAARTTNHVEAILDPNWSSGGRFYRVVTPAQP